MSSRSLQSWTRPEARKAAIWITWKVNNFDAIRKEHLLENGVKVDPNHILEFIPENAGSVSFIQLFEQN